MVIAPIVNLKIFVQVFQAKTLRGHDMRKLFTFIFFILLVFSILILPFSVIGNSVGNLNQFPYPITLIFSDGNNLLIGTESGLFISNDEGRSFVQKNSGLSDTHITGIVRSGDKYFIGTSEGGLYAGNVKDQKWISFSNKVNCPTISSVSSKDNMIFVTSLCTGFHVSFDYGSTWLDINSGLPTQKTTSFISTESGRNFLGTEDSGLYYSESLDEKTVWQNLLPEYSVTSLSYFMGSLFVGTSSGLFKGNVGIKFQKMDFIGGEPYIAGIIYNNDRLFVAIQNFGVFVTLDGINFYDVLQGQVLFPRSLYLENSSRKLYIGDNNGNLSLIDLSLPLLVCRTKIDLGVVNEGNKLSGSFSIVNIGYGALNGTIFAPAFIKLNKTNFINTSSINFIVDTAELSPDNYTVPIKISSNIGAQNIYISFKVLEVTEIKITLTIDSKDAYVNGEKILLDAPPFIDKQSSRTLVPLRFISQAFGAEVEWDEKLRKVTIKKAPTKNNPAILIELWPGDKTAKVNLKSVELDVAPVIIPPGRTMVPLRFISESFGSSVSWDGINRRITIIYKR